MPKIYVRAKQGRVARESPRGNIIPHDRFIPVEPTAYIDRLINVHGDIELKPITSVKKPDAPVAKPKAE